MKIPIIFVSLSLILMSVNLQAQKVKLSDGRYNQTEYKPKTAANGLALRELRRAGVGFVAAGELGLLGAKVELNLTPLWSVSGAFGGSRDFSAFSFQAVRYMNGTNFLPYMGAGIARWHGNPGNKSSTTPSVLADTLWNSSDKQKGRVRELLLTPKLGLQYLTTSGPYAGYGFFAEVVVLVDIQDLVMAPTGSLGLSYYF